MMQRRSDERKGGPFVTCVVCAPVRQPLHPQPSTTPSSHASSRRLPARLRPCIRPPPSPGSRPPRSSGSGGAAPRSEEHTSELQSQSNLVCRLLLEKKKITVETTNSCNRSYKHAH